MSKNPYCSDEYFTKKAKTEGIRARSYYKLEEIDYKFNIFPTLTEKDWILDMGCCPGSWVQYAFKASRGKTNIVGIDLKEVENFPEFQGKFHFLKGDVEDMSLLLPGVTGNQKFSVIMSDMAPDTSGNSDQDSYLSYELVLSSWKMAKKHLSANKKGAYIAKYFQGKESGDLINQIKHEVKEITKSQSLFGQGKVKIFKPSSCRKNSREIYLIVK